MNINQILQIGKQLLPIIAKACGYMLFMCWLMLCCIWPFTIGETRTWYFILFDIGVFLTFLCLFMWAFYGSEVKRIFRNTK